MPRRWVRVHIDRWLGTLIHEPSSDSIDFPRHVFQSAPVALPPLLVSWSHVVVAFAQPHGPVDERRRSYSESPSSFHSRASRAVCR